jgi:hypothetical protein
MVLGILGLMGAWHSESGLPGSDPGTSSTEATMRLFTCLGVIGGAVVGLGLTAEAFAETAEAEKVLGVECPSALRESLDAAFSDSPAIVLVVPKDKPDALLAACLTGGLEATPCDPQKDNCPPLGTPADGIASFYRGSSPGAVCWYPPLGGGPACNQISP